MAQNFVYPPTFSTSVNPSVGPNGSPIPTSSTLVAGKGPTGLETPVSVDASGNVNVVIAGGIANPLPVADAAAEASLASIDGKTVHVDTGNVTVVASALPTGASTGALQTAGNASLASIDTKLTSPLTVTGPLTDTQLRASAVPVSVSSLPLPTGAATAANQATQIASLSSIDGKTPALGQALAAGSVPVVLTASQITALTPLSTVTANQGTPNTAPNGWPVKITDGTNTAMVNVNGSITVAGISAVGAAPVNPPVGVSGVDGGGLKRTFLTDTSGRLEIDTIQTLPLPTGAATAANQATETAAVSAFSAKTGAAFVTAAFDFATITYNGITTDINTVVYKTGGSGGTTVATLTLGYDGSNRLSTITKT